jgi:hypothetical protein
MRQIQREYLWLLMQTLMAFSSGDKPDQKMVS